MGLTMLGVENFSLEPKGVPELAVHIELVLQPHWCGLEERLEAAGGYAEIRLQNALELEKRLVVEANKRQIGGPNPDSVEAVFHRLGRERCVALLPREPFLLRSSDDLAVAQQTSRTVVVECRNAEDIRVGHGRSACVCKTRAWRLPCLSGLNAFLNNALRTTAGRAQSFHRGRLVLQFAHSPLSLRPISCASARSSGSPRQR